MIFLAVWLTGFVGTAFFIPRMARWIYDGEGYHFPHADNEPMSVALAVVGAVAWPFVLLSLATNFFGKLLIEFSFTERRAFSLPRRRKGEFAQGEVWALTGDVEPARVVIAGLNLRGALIVQGLDDDGEHHLMELTAEELKSGYAPNGETIKLGQQ